MRFAGRLVLAWLACGVLGLVWWPAGVFAGESVSSGGSLVLSESPLVVPGAEALVGGGQAAEEALRASPEAVREREASETAYAGLAPGDGQALVDRMFPRLTSEADGGLRGLPAGEHVSEYLSRHAARLSLPDGSFGILESLGQIATRGSDGRWAPLDLGLAESGGGYGARRSDVAVRLPKDLAEGVSLPGIGVSLVPLGASGGAAAGASPGSVDGYGLFWGGSSMGADVDLLGRLTSSGADLVAILRSQASPQELRFRVGMPAGARLVQDAGSNVVRVLEEGQTVATVAAPAARDAQGAEVPLRVAVEGDVLTVTVEHPAGRWAYPIMTDPEINDSQLAATSGGKRSNWQFSATSEARFGHKMVYESAGVEHLETSAIAEYKATEIAYWGYETKGNSKIFELKAETEAKSA